MANRVLRDWTTSEKIDSLSEASELFFVRLIMKADDHGCFHANTKLLKAALFPLKSYSETKVSNCVKELSEAGIIILYDHEGRQYLKINDFGQRLRTMVSKFPQPADNPLTIDSNKPPETKGSRKEVETEYVDEGTKKLGTGKYYFLVLPPIINSIKYRVQGIDGLNDFMLEHGSVLNLPAYAEKFMRKNNGAHFNDFKHVFNAYNKFTENGNA